MTNPNVVSKVDNERDLLLEKIYDQMQTIQILEGELAALHKQLLVSRGGMSA